MKIVNDRALDTEGANTRLSGPSRGQALATSDGQTRAAIVELLLEQGPITAVAISQTLGLAAPGVRRHLDILVDSGDARSEAAPRHAHKGRGRPPKVYSLTAKARGKLDHAYDDLASAALRSLRNIGGDEAVNRFARDRVTALLAGVDTDANETIEERAEAVAAALTLHGYSANVRKVGNGVQICQHHCPISGVTAEHSELCDAEISAFSNVLGTHVQRLATIANGDSVCTTHVPLPLKDTKTHSS